MAEAVIAVTSGSGKNTHTWDRTISAVLVQDQFVLPGEYPYASYTVVFEGVSSATAADHIVQIMAGTTNYVRIRRIRFWQEGSAAAAAQRRFQILRLTTAGTGGSAITPAKHDNGDSAAGATAMTLPTVKGTESTLTLTSGLVLHQAVLTTATQPENVQEWVQSPNSKPLIIPAGTSNGICLKTVTGNTSATLAGIIEFVETAWLGA